MIFSHKIQINTTYKHAEFFKRACGTARYTWNWAVAECQKAYAETGKKPDIGELKKRWNAEKPEWVYESPKDANQRPFSQLQKAFSAAFNRLKSGKKHNQVGFPRFRKKWSTDSFYLSNDKVKVNGDKLRIPLLGWVRMQERLRLRGKLMSVTVSTTAGKWFASFSVEGDFSLPSAPAEIVGVDLGCKEAAVLSTGEHFVGPKPLKKKMKKLRRLSKALSRKKNGSNRREKAKRALAKLHYRISNIRKDFQHKLTTKICHENQVVVLEDLNVAGMVKNKRLSKAIMDVGFREIRRQIEYKVKRYGGKVVIADRFYPSSKTCNCCGYVKDSLTLSERVFRCEKCGLEIDRDLNAALNLRTLGLRGTNARGQNTLPKDLDEPRTKPYSVVGTN